MGKNGKIKWVNRWMYPIRVIIISSHSFDYESMSNLPPKNNEYFIRIENNY